MNQCSYISTENNKLTKCHKQSKYGCYCSKHKRFHLLSDKNIIMNHFTFKSGDYLKKDLVRFYSKYCDTLCKYQKHEKKEFYFTKVSDIITQYTIYREKYISEIIKIQSIIRKFLARESFKITNKICSNNEDFYTFELIKEIDPAYLYIYKDTNHFRWGFDIRSIHKLINQGFDNPYTMEPIPKTTKLEVMDGIKNLTNKGLEIDFKDTMERDRKTIIKQKTVDLFSQIELLGYSCNIEWFLRLSLDSLKILYKQLEDIWNYRAQLPFTIKRAIAPPDGKLFSHPLSEIKNYTVLEDLQDLLLGELSKISSAIDTSNKQLGYMYFIIGLSSVSRNCYLTHESWLIYI